MKNIWLGAASLAVLGWLPMPVQAQLCAGDCDGGKSVGISELITCVNISLGNAQLSGCTACDFDGGGSVGINELILAVSSSLNGCVGGPTPTPIVGGAVCGNGTIDDGEECDDGPDTVCVGGTSAGSDCTGDADCPGGACKGPFGGDGCAANCTMETEKTTLQGTFDPDMTKATVQTIGPTIDVKITGGQTFRAGSKRDDVVMGPGNTVLFQSGEIPVVIRASELHFNPVKVSTVACACVRGVPAPDLFGPGNAVMGVIGCGPQGLTDVNYRVVQDHNTDATLPTGSQAKDFCMPPRGTAEDPECDDQSAIPIPGNPTSEGTVSSACREQGSDPRCSVAAQHGHRDVCNGPRILTRFGGPAPQGSTFMVNNTSISLLLDGAQCDTTGLRGGTCPANLTNAGYGPDCLPCTDDDKDILPPNTLPTTSGTAEAVVYDVNNGENAGTAGQCVVIDVDEGASGCTNRGCITRVQGVPVQCDKLTGDNPAEALKGASLVVAFPSIDANLIKDTVTTTTFFNQ